MTGKEADKWNLCILNLKECSAFIVWHFAAAGVANSFNRIRFAATKNFFGKITCPVHET
jgi:hypothetical protein